VGKLSQELCDLIVREAIQITQCSTVDPTSVSQSTIDLLLAKHLGVKLLSSGKHGMSFVQLMENHDTLKRPVIQIRERREEEEVGLTASEIKQRQELHQQQLQFQQQQSSSDDGSREARRSSRGEAMTKKQRIE